MSALAKWAFGVSLEGGMKGKCKKMVEIARKGSMNCGSEFAIAKLSGVQSARLK